MTRGLRWLLIALALVFGVTASLAYVTKPVWARQAYFGLAHLLGRAEGCRLQESLTLRFSDDLQQRTAQMAAQCSSRPSRHRGILRWDTPSGEFWAPAGTGLPFLLAEQSLDVYGAGGVEPGDIVLDCGANVGTFTRHALLDGASIVVAIEPSPRNILCLRQTFKEEIAQDKVVLVEAALWHEPGLMELSVFDNSALDSLVMDERAESSSGSTKVSVPLTTLDDLVRKLQIERVDFIKMDIEGAERNALRGAAETIRRFLPRLAIATENLPDDIREVPAIIKAAAPSYVQQNGPCRMVRFLTLRPEAVYFSPEAPSFTR